MPQVAEHWREQQRTRRTHAARQQGLTPAALLAERQVRQRLDGLSPKEQACFMPATRCRGSSSMPLLLRQYISSSMHPSNHFVSSWQLLAHHGGGVVTFLAGINFLILMTVLARQAGVGQP